MILLSFDIEEFDMPLEYGKEISFEDQIEISTRGTHHILDILERNHVKATFFSTVVFAQHSPELIKRILKSGHELASHGYYHSKFEPAHLASSKIALEEISGKEITGFRMARMMPVDEKEVAKAGYTYNSSINPTWLPGRYNNLHLPRKFYNNENVWQIPASVSPLVRFPLFWLSFHNLPLGIYTLLAKWTIRKDGYLNTYFHPWEFTDLKDKERFNFPGYVEKNTGDQMIARMDQFIKNFKKQHFEFSTISDFVKNTIEKG